METRANNVLIGVFTLTVIVAALAFVAWFARLADSAKVDHYQIVFSGSVSGLTVGSAVLFNGIRVGQIDALELMPDDPSRVIGRVTVKDTTPVKVDTRARMEFQGVTGGAYVQLYGGSSSAPKLEPGPDQQVATIYAERSELQNLVDGARDTVTQAAQTLTRIDEFIRKNEGELTATVANVRKFTQALADNSDAISDFLKTTGAAAKQIGQFAESLNGMTDDVKGLIKAIDPAKIDQIVSNVVASSDRLRSFVSAFDSAQAKDVVDNIEQFTKTLADARQPLTAFANDASQLAGRLNAMAPKLEASLDSIQKVAGSIDGEKVGRIVTNVERVTATFGENAPQIDAFLKDTRKLSADLASMTPKLGAAFDSFNRVAGAIDPAKVDRVVANVDKFAQTLGDSTQKVQGFVDDASDIGRKLNAAADRLDTIVKNVEAMTTSEEGKGMFAQISDAAKAVRELATNLDTRTAELSKNLNQFAGPGLRDYRTLANDGQKTLRDIQRTLNSLQRNPQQLLLGPKSSIPDFKGQ